MVNYEKIFEPYYEGGWEAYPLETTLITAGALNDYDAALMHIEDYLANQIDPNDNLAETYDETETYEAGEYRIYNGVLYKCLEDIDEAEEFDPTKWQACLVTDEMGSGGGGGTTVIANPVGEPTDDLETIQIGNTIYGISGGGGNANIWTGTKAEYEAQASQIDDDTVVLITDDEERTQAFDIYSTDEQVIGTWTNGKPIYRKIFVLSSTVTLSGQSWTNLTGVPNDDIDLVKKMEIHPYDGGMRNYIPVMASVGNAGVLQAYSFRNSNVTMNSGTNVVVEYTKLSDTV